jgi:hypothetical protein
MGLLDNTMFEDKPLNAGEEILAHMLADKYISYCRLRKCAICGREDAEVHHFLFTKHDKRKDVGRIIRIEEFKYNLPHQLVTIHTPKPIAACVYCTIGRRAKDEISRLPTIPHHNDRIVGVQWQRPPVTEAEVVTAPKRPTKSKPTLADL